MADRLFPSLFAFNIEATAMADLEALPETNLCRLAEHRHASERLERELESEVKSREVKRTKTKEKPSPRPRLSGA